MGPLNIDSRMNLLGGHAKTR